MKVATLAVTALALAACSRANPVDPAKPAPPSAHQAHPPDANLADDVYIAYHHDAETAYEDVVADGESLNVRWLDPAAVHCANPVAQEPCWKPSDMKTRTRQLTPAERHELAQLVDRSGIMKDDDPPGPGGNRAYPFTLNIRRNGVTRKIVYYSAPGMAPMPDGFARVQGRMEDLLRGMMLAK